MAVNESRSLNGDLKEGITDGVIKKLAPNRGGSNTDFAAAQAVYNDLHHELYDQAVNMVNTVAERITAL